MSYPTHQCFADVPPGPPFLECELEQGHAGPHQALDHRTAQITADANALLDQVQRDWEPWIAERERLAVAEAFTAARERVAALGGYRDPRYSGRFESPGLISRAAVLEILEAPQ